MNSTIKIDTQKIPKIEMDILARRLIEAMKVFYSDPENLRGFEEWKARKKEEEARG